VAVVLQRLLISNTHLTDLTKSHLPAYRNGLKLATNMKVFNAEINPPAKANN